MPTSNTCSAEDADAAERIAAENLRFAGSFHRQGRLREAEQLYRAALVLKPGYLEAQASLDKIQNGSGFPGGTAAAHVRRGHELFAAQRYGEALAAYDQAPAVAEAWLGRARTLRHLQRMDEAVAAYREALARGGDAEVISFSLASLDAAPVPPAVPTRLIASSYDQHADHYDRHMIDVLNYRIPEHVIEALGTPLPARALDVLDLGCGTGLMGARLRPFARTLTGVDLSSGMLRVARRRQIFDNLLCMELLAFLRAQKACFDLALAADVLVYFGDLSDLFAAVGNALRAGGRFAFSVEASADREFVLKPSLRFVHSEAHVRRRAQDHGFVVQTLAPKALRREAGSDVAGYVGVLRRA